MLAYLGKMRIFVRTNIRTLPIENPQIRILPPADYHYHYRCARCWRLLAVVTYAQKERL